MRSNETRAPYYWPENLLFDVSPQDFAPILDGARKPVDFEGSLEYALASLSGGDFIPETRDIIRSHYQDGKSVEQTAEELHVSVDDVNEAIHKSLRHLNQLFFKQILCLGLKAHTEFASSAAWRLGYQCGLNQQQPPEELDISVEDLVAPPEQILNVEPDTPIEVLGLSNRSINVLKRAGIRKVYDIICQSEASFARMPNCGRSTLIEVKAALKKFNMDFGCAPFFDALV